MVEVFNSKYQRDFANRMQSRRCGRGRGGYFGGGGGGGGFGDDGYYGYNSDADFRQYISQRVKDVSVACYLGRDCAIRDYSTFSISKIYRKEALIAAAPH